VLFAGSNEVEFLVRILPYR